MGLYSIAVGEGHWLGTYRNVFCREDEDVVWEANEDMDTTFSRAPFFPWSWHLHFNTKETALENVIDAINTCNLDEFGHALHQLQDSYSHKKYRGIWGGWLSMGVIGHALPTFVNTVTFGHVWEDTDTFDWNRLRDTDMISDSKFYQELFVERCCRIHPGHWRQRTKRDNKFSKCYECSVGGCNYSGFGGEQEELK